VRRGGREEGELKKHLWKSALCMIERESMTNEETGRSKRGINALKKKSQLPPLGVSGAKERDLGAREKG